MVRKYKKKPFYEASKIPEEQVFKVVACYAMGQSARICAEQTGLSRQSVQNIYSAVGERVVWLLEGNFPTTNNKLGDFLEKFGDVAVFNTLLELMKEKSAHILSLYGAEITYEDYQNYRDSGEITVDEERGETETNTTRFFRYRLFQLLTKMSEKNYGMKEEHYAKHYAFCQIYFMVKTLMVTLLENETAVTGKTHADFHAGLLSQVDGDEKKAQLETMIFEAQCNMVLCMLLIFSLYEQAI
jgi:hypothetical protein